MNRTSPGAATGSGRITLHTARHATSAAPTVISAAPAGRCQTWSCGAATGQSRKVDRALGLSAAHQHPAVHGTQGEDVAGLDDVAGAGAGIGRDADGVRAVRRADACGDPDRGLDRHREGGAVLVGVVGTTESTVFNVLKIAGFASGPVLGLFLLAVASPRVKQPAALMGFVVGVTGLSMAAWGTDLYWPWYAAVGALLTWSAGWLIQLLIPASKGAVPASVEDKVS